MSLLHARPSPSRRFPHLRTLVRILHAGFLKSIIKTQARRAKSGRTARVDAEVKRACYCDAREQLHRHLISGSLLGMKTVSPVVVVGLALTFVCLVLFVFDFGFIQAISNHGYDSFMRHIQQPAKSGVVVIVDLDDATIHNPLYGQWPWPRYRERGWLFWSAKNLKGRARRSS